MSIVLSPQEISENYQNRGQIKVQDKIIDIPALYTGKGITAIFPISYKKAVKLIDSSSAVPAILWPGKATLSITIFDFSESPVGPYKELVFSIPILHKPIVNIPLLPLLFNKFFKKFGFHVVDVIQSTKIAIEHGNALTGYPHNNELIDLEFNEDGDKIEVRVKTDTEDILTLTSSKPNKGANYFQTYMTYFDKDGKSFKIQMDIYGLRQKINKCKLSLGKSHLSQIITQLGTRQDSLQTQYYPNVTEVNPVSIEEI